MIRTFQAIIHQELPAIDLVAAGAKIVANKRVHNFAPGGEGINYSFADIWLDPAG
jgi:peptide/nickel transport system substrate-binding protein